MARLTRKFLTALGIEDENVQDQIIAAHTETTDALKEQRDSYKADAEKLPEVQKELDGLKSQEGDEDKYKNKYDQLKKDFDNYKEEQQQKETSAKKKAAYKKLLKEAKISTDALEDVLRISEFDKIEFDEDGNVKDADKLKESIKEKWKTFITETKETGAHVGNPPEGAGKSTPVSRAKQLQQQYYADRYNTKIEEAK